MFDRIKKKYLKLSFWESYYWCWLSAPSFFIIVSNFLLLLLSPFSFLWSDLKIQQLRFLPMKFRRNSRQILLLAFLIVIINLTSTFNHVTDARRHRIDHDKSSPLTDSLSRRLTAMSPEMFGSSKVLVPGGPNPLHNRWDFIIIIIIFTFVLAISVLRSKQIE